MKTKITPCVFIVLLFFSGFVYGKPRVTISQNPITHFNPGQSPAIVVVQRVNINANNINSIFQNTGIFNQNTALQNQAGFEWPKGSAKHACFTAGLSIGAYINDSLAQTMASYRGEWSPGYYNNSVYQTSPDFKIYSVKAGDNSSNNPDYANWFKMIPYGAPYVDINKNGQYDQDIDKPGKKDAGQTAFIALADGDESQHSTGEGFGGGILKPLLRAQIALTIWAYNSPGLENLQFVNWVIVNRGVSQWNRTYIGVVVDPDLGDSDDDYIGCDTLQNLGYCYNADNQDPDYGTPPPAFGMDYFKSPIIKTLGQPNDTLGLTSFTFFTNPSTSNIACELDPSGEPVPAYRMLTGVKKDGSPYLNPMITPPLATKFVYPGFPETNAGWNEAQGSIQNCGGLTGPVLTVNPPGDRRFIFSSGRESFVVNPNDTQNIVLAQFVALGSTNLNSVKRVRDLSRTAQKIYDADFNVTPPPAPPVVTPVFTPTVPGQVNITLNWGDASESYRFWDSVFYDPEDSNIYKFQGYQIYEVDRFASSLPNFSDPATIDNSLTLLAIYDLRDSIGVVIDTFSTGVTVNQQEQFAPFPIVPPYSMPTPAGFPNTGIYRSITLTKTQYPQNYGGNTSFIYGQEYKFAVVAYAVSESDSIQRGFRVVANSVSTQTMSIIPVAPPIGTTFTMKNNDTLNTNYRDLGVTPIIKNQDLLKNATYRVLFGTPDTTYRIIRLLDGATDWDTLKRVPESDDSFVSFAQDTSAKVLYLKYPRFAEWWMYSTAFDSSRIVDGVYINVQKIRFNHAGGANYTGNVGIIKDPSATVSRDSIQTRYQGWTYEPEGRRFVQGSQYVRAAGPWQSQSMSISYPTAGTWNNLGSTVRPEGLRKVRITWTGGDTNSGQVAYRYLDTAANDASYIFQNMKRVPFIVEEIELLDSTTQPRRLNCAFVESPDINPVTGSFTITPDSLGGKTLLYIFNSDYSETPNPFYTTKNLFITNPIDVMYVWSPRLLNPGAAPSNGDVLTFYPYTVTRPFVQGNIPLYYEFRTQAPVFGNTQTAKDNKDMDKIRIVPNPYYGYSTLQAGIGNRFVEFRNLPLECRISIYSLNGDLMATIDKTAGNNTATSSTARWNLQNLENVPVASGIYVALVDAPGVGQKVIKMVVFTAQERINFTN